jgi:signal transduction histidine kinase
MAEEATARIWRLQALTAAFSETLTVAEVADVVVRREFVPLGVHLGVITLLSEDEKSLEMVGHYGIPESIRESYMRMSLDTPLPITDAVKSGEPIWIPSDSVYREQYSSAAQATLPKTKSRALAALPLMVEGRAIGGIGMSFIEPQSFNEEQRAFMMAIAQQCAQALERARLHEQAQIAAANEERQRLARDLHDAVSQTLFSATTMAEVIPVLWERNPKRGREQLAQMVTLNRAAMAEMRSLLLELRPDAIVRTSLSALLRQLEEAVKGRRNIETGLNIIGTETPLEPDAHVAFYRIAQEALNNMVKHSGATRVTVELQYGSDSCILRIQDNGKGFDSSNTSAGMGMNTMRERAESMGARLIVQSQPSVGTQITLEYGTPSETRG